MKTKIFLFAILLLIFSFVNIFSQEKIATQKDTSFYSQIDTTICLYLTTTDTAKWKISKEDSIKAHKDLFYPGYLNFRKVQDIRAKISKGRLKLQDQIEPIINLLEQAQDKFEQAIKINPINKTLRLALTRTYQSIEQYYGAAKNDKKRFYVINILLCIEKNRERLIYLHNILGHIYRRNKLWEQAEKNFQLATDYIFEGDVTKIDSTKLFNNLYFRGEAQLKLYKAHLSLTSFSYARQIAPSKKRYDELTGLIDYINWDNGNIHASELNQNIILLTSKGNYAEAEKRYFDLLESIQTQKARCITQYNLSFLQFRRLHKNEDGINRLWLLLKILTNKSGKKILSDSLISNYWQAYAQMCYRLANENFNKDRKKSFAYYYRVTNIECSKTLKGRALLSMANLSSNNADLCLNYCDQASSLSAQFTEGEKKTLYQLFYLSNATKGNFDDALKWFKKYKEKPKI